jgi:hypothetical protein
VISFSTNAPSTRAAVSLNRISVVNKILPPTVL